MANVYGSNYNDNSTTNGFPFIYRPSLYGTNANDFMYGYAGNDRMFGFAGNDYLNGGTGADAMYGGTGNDIYIVDNVGDTVNESAGAGYDTVYSSISEILSVNVERLILTGTGNNYGYGNALNNSISGNSGNNYLWGAAGNDVMYGYAGNDTMNGGTGADTMYGGTGSDTYYVDNVGDIVSEAASAGYDTVRASVTEALSANVERLILTGSGNINGYGNSLSNSIYGNSGSNYLSGYAGNDYILGGAKTDTLVGGSGNDRLNGYGGTTGEYDILSGDFSTSTPGAQGVSDGADIFMLGDASKAFYLGAGYATIKDFYHAEGDKFPVSGGIGDYSLNKSFNFGGTAANDTAIYYKNDLIGVVQDTTNVLLSADFQFV